MTVPDLAQAIPAAAVALGQTSLQVALLAAIVWGACRALPRMSHGVRTTLWWLVCAKVVVGLVWLQPVRLPLLPVGVLPVVHDGFRTGGDAMVLGGEDRELSSSPPATAGRQDTALTPPAQSPPGASASGYLSGPGRPAAVWPTVVFTVIAAWLAGVLWHLARTVVEWRRLRTLWRGASTAPASTTRRLASLAPVVGLSRVPACRVSDRTSTAQVIGLRHPVVLLPARLLGTLTPAEQEMTLCHELVHLKRRDLWWGVVPTLAERLLFFHPLVRAAAREYALAREAACDEAVLRLLDAPADQYGRLLLSFGIDARHRGLATTGASSSSFHALKRRLLMLESATRRDTRLGTGRHTTRWWAVAAVAIVAFAPIHVTGQVPSTGPPPPGPAVAPTPLVPKPPPAPAMPAVPAVAASGQEQQATPRPPAPPEPASPQPARVRPDRDHDLAWVFLDEDHTSTSNASQEDTEEARRLRSDVDGALLWIRRGQTRYVVRDPATLHEVEALFEPMRELGRQQAALGAEQARLGEQQAQLGSQQAALGSEQAALGSKVAGMQAQLLRAQADRLDERAGNHGAGDVNDETVRAREAEVHQARRQLDAEMKRLGERQRTLGAEQRVLGGEQRELGARQRALGAKQREAGDIARRELSILIDRAIDQGVAQEVR